MHLRLTTLCAALGIVAIAAAQAVAAQAVAAQAAAADRVLTAGVATTDITPEPGLRLWGYSTRTHGATGTLDPLMAKAVVLRAGDQSVAIVSLDLGRTPEDAVLEKIRMRTKAECGLENLFVTASHTHHAPVMESAPGDPNPYADHVGDEIARIICEAAKGAVPVKVGVGRGEADLAHNRRHFLPDGRVAMQWRNAKHEPTQPVDRQYAVIRLDRADGSPLAVLFHYACHPVVMGGDNYQYSADYVGTACDLVEKELQTKCLFLQGACGNINPYMDKTPLDQGGVEEMRKMGRALGELLTKTARDTSTAAAARPSIQFQARKLPLRVRWDLGDPAVRSVLSRAYGPRFDNYLAKTIKDNTVPCTLTTLLLDGDLALVGMPGEIFVQFQMQLKKESPIANTFLVGYTNGYHAYFPTIRDAAAGGYGGKTATYVEPGAGERLTNEALITLYKFADQLHDVPREQDFKLLEYDEVQGEK
ncbi:MAG: neutral/alkaline non-lysosomal ceramidase N-terminal domain-containing protein [Pirellulales bacterium]